ncbi:GNAT family N-acetyltransferase [Saccharothrix isguenensis]
MPGLVLTALTAADAESYYAVLDRNRDHLNRHGDHVNEAHATLAWVTDHLARPGPDWYGIRLEDRLVGRVDLAHAAPPGYGLGYWLSHDATGHGYATAACTAIVRHARTFHGATDIFAGVTHGNHRSVALLGRLGFRPITEFETYTRFHLPLNPPPQRARDDVPLLP